MRNLKGKQEPDFLLDSSFVMCTCAKQPPAGLDKLDTECFDYYRLLTATDDNNGVFGKDSPFIRDIDCQPFINLANFSQCQADYYVSALQDIAGQAYRAMQNYQVGSRQYEALKDKYLRSLEYANHAQGQSGYARADRNYHCVLELIDTWFHADDKVAMSNGMEKLAAAKEAQAGFRNQINGLIRELRQEHNRYLEEVGYLQKMPSMEEVLHPEQNQDSSFAEIDWNLQLNPQRTPAIDVERMDLSLDKQSETVAENEQLAREIKETNDMTADINAFIDKVEAWSDSAAPQAYQAIDPPKSEGEAGGDGASPQSDEKIESGSSVSTYIDDIDAMLSGTRIIKRDCDSILEAVKKFRAIAEKHGIVNSWKKIVQNLQVMDSSLIELTNTIEQLRSGIYERPSVTEESFLVCRCGGIINVVQNGDWINISKDQLVPNIIDLLSFAENYLYDEYNPDIYGDVKYSIIKAFNIVHGALMYMSGTDRMDKDYIIDAACEAARKPAAHVDIRVRPAADMLKQARQIDALKNALTFTPGWIGKGFTLVFSFSDIIEKATETERFGWRDYVNPVEGVGNSLYHLLLKKAESNIIEAAEDLYGQVSSTITILQDLTYKSYAAFIGEIAVTVTTFREEYKFVGTYDIFGKSKGDYKVRYSLVQKSPFLIEVPEDNRTKIKYKIYEDGEFKEGEESAIMY